MKDYLIKINDLIVALEAGHDAVEVKAAELKKVDEILSVKEEKLRSVENDVNARLRIAEKYESLEVLKASADKAIQDANLAKAEALKAEQEADVAKSDAESKIAEARTEREIVSGKIIALKDREAALKIREDKLKTEFIKKLEAELKS